MCQTVKDYVAEKIQQIKIQTHFQAFAEGFEPSVRCRTPS